VFEKSGQGKEWTILAIFVENLRKKAGKSAYKTKDVMLEVIFLFKQEALNG
jgi:hypothetical protein